VSVSRRRQRPRNGGSGQVAGAIFGFVVMFMLASYVSRAIFGVDILANMSGGASGVQSAPKVGKTSSAVSRKILAEAVKYDNKPYIWAAGHPPTEAIARRGVDCSGLINVAVMKATGIKEDNLAESFRRSKHWKKIAMKSAGAGDIMYDLRDPGDSADHVALVVDNKGSGKLTIFEARTRHGPLSEQIRYSYNQKYKRFDGALRFTG